MVIPRIAWISSDSAFLEWSESWPKVLRDRLLNTTPSSEVNLTTIRAIANLCSRRTQQSPEVPTNGRWLIDQPDLCTNRGGISLLVIIHSHTDNFERRELIRTTWGSLNRVGKHKLEILFVLGYVKGDSKQKRVLEEDQQYHDIIQGDFMESYHNMTTKHLSFIEWLTRGRCPGLRYVLKVDDDTFVDMFHVVKLLDSGDFLSPAGFYCSATENSKVARKPEGFNDKWVVSAQEYPFKYYPPYCEGYAYLMDARLAPYIYWCSAFVRKFWIDDVYVTGVVAEQLGAPRKQFVPGHSYDRIGPYVLGSNLLDNLFFTASFNEFTPVTGRRLWRLILEKQAYFN